jgi:hypothetical protein
MKTFKKVSFVVALLTSVLAGCGGGTSTASGLSLSGTAAVGSPIVGGTVALVCASGSAVTPTTTNTAGAWSVTLTGQTLPCVVQVSGGTINSVANSTSYHSVTSSAGTVNVTPITDLIVSNLAGTGTPSTWFSALNAAALSPLTPTAVTAATAQIKTALGLSALTAIDPLTVSFNPASGNAMDDVLTALQAAILSNGTSFAALRTAASSSTFTPPVGFSTALSTAHSGTVSGSTGGTTVIAPSAPTGLTATAVSSSQINLAWTAVSGATGYNVFSSTAAGVVISFSTINTTSPVTVLTYSSTGRSASTAYYYKVTAVNSAGSSVGSNEALATTSAAPVVGTGLTVTPAANGLTSFPNAVPVATLQGTDRLLSYRKTSTTPDGTDYFDIAHQVVSGETYLNIDLRVGNTITVQGSPATAFVSHTLFCTLIPAPTPSGIGLCSTKGIVFDRTAGRVTMTNTPLTRSVVVNGSFSFTPF